MQKACAALGLSKPSPLLGSCEPKGKATRFGRLLFGCQMVTGQAEPRPYHKLASKPAEGERLLLICQSHGAYGPPRKVANKLVAGLERLLLNYRNHGANQL